MTYEESEKPEVELEIVTGGGVKEDTRSSLSTCNVKKRPPDKEVRVLLQEEKPRQTGVKVGVETSLLTRIDEKLPPGKTRLKDANKTEEVHAGTQVSLLTKPIEILLRNESLGVYLSDIPRVKGVKTGTRVSLSTRNDNKLLPSKIPRRFELITIEGTSYDPGGLLFSKPPGYAHLYDPFERG